MTRTNRLYEYTDHSTSSGSIQFWQDNTCQTLQADLDDLYLYLSVDSFAETIWRWYRFPTLDEVNAAGARGDYLRVFTNGSAIISNARSSVWPKQGTMSSSTPSICGPARLGTVAMPAQGVLDRSGL